MGGVLTPDRQGVAEEEERDDDEHEAAGEGDAADGQSHMTDSE